MFFLIKFVSYSFDCYFFLLWQLFLIDFFLILSFNIKLVRNWGFLLSPGLGFYGLRVLEINRYLGGLPEFA